MNGAIKPFQKFHARRVETLQGGDELIGIIEVDIGGFDEIGGDDPRIFHLERPADEVGCWQILFDRFKRIDPRPYFQ